MGITVTKWRLLPVINVLALGQDTANRLARALDRYADKQLRRIPVNLIQTTPTW